MNKAIFEGNIANNIEQSISQSGKKVVINQIMVRDGKDANGKNKYQYIPFVAYEQKAEFISTYMQKGTACTVECHYNAYKGRDGSYKHTFIVDNIEFASKDYGQEKPQETVTEEDWDDRLPF